AGGEPVVTRTEPPSSVLVRQARRDPALGGLLVAAVIVLAGFGLIGFGWRGVARTLVVGVQVPELVTGAIGGLALVAFGAAGATLVLARRAAAAEQRVSAVIASQSVDLALAAPALRRRVEDRRRRRTS